MCWYGTSPRMIRSSPRRPSGLSSIDSTEDEPGYISLVALVETVWVLQRHYRLGALDLAQVIRGLLEAPVIVVESVPEVFLALTAVQEGRGAFSDVLIAALGSKAGCSTTMTFDRKAARLRGFSLT